MQHRDAFQPSRIHQRAEAIPPHNERREQGCQNAERKGDGEALHGSSRFPKKNRRGDQRRDVGVENGAERFLVRRVQSDLKRFSKRHFFAQPLVNQHVCINRKTNGQDNTSDTGQREDEMEHR